MVTGNQLHLTYLSKYATIIEKDYPYLLRKKDWGIEGGIMKTLEKNYYEYDLEQAIDLFLKTGKPPHRVRFFAGWLPFHIDDIPKRTTHKTKTTRKIGNITLQGNPKGPLSSKSILKDLLKDLLK